jgi:HD superfamily phosphodiesterase
MRSGNLRFSPETAPPEVQHLIDGLSAGADAPLLSVDDWAQRLRDNPVANETGNQVSEQFIEQMRLEWFPVTAPNEICQQMMDFVHEHLAAYRGWPHIWAHILRVTGNALALASEAGVDPAHAFMLGIFHDSGKLQEFHGGDDHEALGAALARAKLRTHYDRRNVTLISSVIAKQIGQTNPHAQLLYDADKLDKIGATGIARRLSTDYGVLHAGIALRRVEDELDRFPTMHYPTSDRLAESKATFTKAFLAQFVG